MPGDDERVYVVCRHRWVRPDVVEVLSQYGWALPADFPDFPWQPPVLLTASSAVRRLEHALRHESSINYKHFVTTVDAIKRGRGDPI